MHKPESLAAAAPLTSLYRGLHPTQANRRPMLFILEVAAALLSVLALRDGILGDRAALLETALAAAAWATLLAVAYGLIVRQSPGGPASMHQT